MSPFRKIAKLVRLRFGLPFVRRADRAREAGEWVEAVVDYRRGLDWMPWREDLKVQIGNCLKEFGDYRGAIRSYVSVGEGSSSPEARKQAADASRRAGTILLPFVIGDAPNEDEGKGGREDLPSLSAALLPDRIRLDAVDPRAWLGVLGREEHVSSRLRGTGFATIKLDQVGSMVLERNGAQEPLLAGVVAVRGRISALATLSKASIKVGEGDASVTIDVSLHLTPNHNPLRLYIFNAWMNAATLPRGRQWLSVSVGDKLPPAGLFVNVVDPVDASLFTTSDSFVTAPQYTPDGLDHAVVASPAIIRPAARTLFDRPITSVLAMRVDQLGDVAASLPSLAMLRNLFPQARLTVLAQPGVQAIIEACGLADEVLPITLTYDPVSERRRLDPAEERRIRSVFSRRQIDLAIDLSPGDESRPLLLLTGAAYLVGFNPDRFTYLDFGIAVRSRDKVNRLEKLSHAATVSMLVNALAIAATPSRSSVTRARDTDTLRQLGLERNNYIVLHLGARHAINRWPIEHFAVLSDRLLLNTPCAVVVFVDDDEASVFTDPRVHVLGRVDSEQFDAILSHARAMVGNDSGPKHLAATRGVPTVSVHVDRLNWNEWGQDGTGTIVSKRIPCTGCGLNDIAMCGREAVCIRSITPDEVYTALKPYL